MAATRWIIFSLLGAGLMVAGWGWTHSWIRPYWYQPRKAYQNENTVEYKTVVTGLKVPWDIAFPLPGEMLITERAGSITYRKNDGKTKRILIEETTHLAEGGLLGLTLHPQFQENRWLYLYVTSKKNSHILNNVFRYRFEDGKLSEEKVIVENIPGAPYHDGGRMAFGPDGYLYITTGDAGDKKLPQDISSLGGKILRVKDDGSIPEDNPFNNAVWSYGHRNPQGLTWDDEGNLWSTEHGPSGLESGYDELNLIEKGGNYGWPLVRGDEIGDAMISPILQSGADDTWAPAGALYWDGSVFFGGLRGQTLYEARIDENPIQLKKHLSNKLGRLRTLVMGPDGHFYLTTSNTDGRGFPKEGDDKVIRIDPREFRK